MKCALKWWKPLRMPTGRWNVRGSSTLASSYQKDWLFFFWKGLRGLVRLVRLVRCWLWKAGWQLVELECKFAGSKYSTMFPWLRRGIPWYLVESSAMPKEQRSIPVGWTAFVSCACCLCPSLRHKAWRRWAFDQVFFSKSSMSCNPPCVKSNTLGF